MEKVFAVFLKSIIAWASSAFIVQLTIQPGGGGFSGLAALVASLIGWLVLIGISALLLLFSSKTQAISQHKGSVWLTRMRQGMVGMVMFVLTMYVAFLTYGAVSFYL